MALCAYPYYQHFSGVFFGCGQCHLCRINKRREWTARLMLEAQQHSKRAFVTLTYDNEHVPKDMNLRPKDLTNYLKRTRRMLSKQGRRFRYFACGEYGDSFGRPHFHIIFFGIDEKELDIIGKKWRDKNGKMFGSIKVGSVTSESLQYVCGYVLKKSLKSQVPGRVKEFSRMSLKPGIGSGEIVRTALLMHETGFFTPEMEKGGDVPANFRINGKMWPIGRYLRKKLRKEMGINAIYAKQANIEILCQEAKEKISQVETLQEFREEVMQIEKFCRSDGKRDKQLEMQLKMQLFNRSRALRSEKLSKIYNKRGEKNK